jgi:hypothetical protein
MKLIKSLLLGSAAGLVAVAGAQAADLPSKKSAPVDYVRVCSAYGAGFFFIPGTETCLRVSGRVRAEYRYFETFNRSDDAIGMRARARFNLDARTQTAYGTLRTFIRYELTRNGGNYGGGSANSSVDLNKAFIQFAGITAGRATSFYDFYSNELNWGGLSFGSDTYGADPVVLAYTASFGSGFSATIAIEDPGARRTGGVFNGGAGFSNFTYAGQRMPEIVGALRVDQAWGSAQLSGAVHQLQSLNFVSAAAVPPGAARPYADTDYGFAIQGGLKLNLPMLAAGDQLWLQAAYADGAVNYLGFGSSLNLGGVQTSHTDAVVDTFGNVKRTKGFSLTAALLHYWTPQIRQAVFGNYAKLDYAAAVEAPVNPLTGLRAAGSTVDTTVFQVGTNLIWTPVSGLDMGVEVLYRKIDPKGRVVDASRVVPGLVYTRGAEDAFEGRLRIQRDF